MKDRELLRCGLVLGILSLVLGTGCQTCEKHCGQSCCDEEAKLPHGFRALHGFDNEAEGASLKGWPRYITGRHDRMVMVYVPSQEILMGGGSQPDEVPARHVKVNHFYIDLHEVTNAQFNGFADAIKPKCPFADCGHGACGSDGICMFRQFWTPGVNNDHPVRDVSWYEAIWYSRWAGKRLPSEAQWEAAARGDDGRVYPWGNQTESDVTKYLANTRTGRDNWDGYEYTAPVMSYAAGVSPFGAFNMAGNVREWCGDAYDLGRYAYPSDEDPPSGLERGPLPFGDKFYPSLWGKDIPEARVGPSRGTERAIRGGSFMDSIERCRVDSRWAAGPGVHMNNVGFRTVLPLPPES